MEINFFLILHQFIKLFMYSLVLFMSHNIYIAAAWVFVLANLFMPQINVQTCSPVTNIICAGQIVLANFV